MESSADGASSRPLRRFRRARNSRTLVDQIGNMAHLVRRVGTPNHYRCLLAIIPVIASKTGRRFAEDIAHSGLLSLLKASFRAIIESLCPSSRSLYSHPAGLAAFLWEPAADPTELNPCSACRAGSHSCKEHARRTGTIRIVPERDVTVPPVRARERMNGRGDPSGWGMEWGQLEQGSWPQHVAERPVKQPKGSVV